MSQSAFTEREHEIMIGAMLCLKGGEINVDLEKLAKMLNFKNKASANASWCKVHNKIRALRLSAEEGGSVAPSTPAPEAEGDTTVASAAVKKVAAVKNAPAKKGGAKRKKSVSPGDDEEGDSVMDEAAPKKKPVKKAAPGLKKTASPGDDEDAASGADENPAKKPKTSVANVKKEIETEYDDEGEDGIMKEHNGDEKVDTTGETGE